MKCEPDGVAASATRRRLRRRSNARLTSEHGCSTERAATFVGSADMGTERVVLIVERDCRARELEGQFLGETGLLVEMVAEGITAWEKTRLRR